ncbi:hypothetical protein [Streptomyces nigrescens]|uniref:hypothetical protein n=1 Tax=Streptomyces nigrescens TaxID=1920 RepID=UPI0021C267A1|nr:hypothetical protein [Streptomyces nigrescens]
MCSEAAKARRGGTTLDFFGSVFPLLSLKEPLHGAVAHHTEVLLLLPDLVLHLCDSRLEVRFRCGVVAFIGSHHSCEYDELLLAHARVLFDLGIQISDALTIRLAPVRDVAQPFFGEPLEPLEFLLGSENLRDLRPYRVFERSDQDLLAAARVRGAVTSTAIGGSIASLTVRAHRVVSAQPVDTVGHCWPSGSEAVTGVLLA